MRLWRRRTVEPLAMAQPVHPLTGHVRRIRREGVAQARAEARRQFEQVLPAARVPVPRPAEMQRWWPSQ